jgi:hypothetical protein
MKKIYQNTIIMATLLMTIVLLFSSKKPDNLHSTAISHICNIENTDDCVTIYNRKSIFST